MKGLYSGIIQNASSFVIFLLLTGGIIGSTEAAKLTGHLVDKLCVSLCENAKSDEGCTPDNANVFYTPEKHTGWCLLLGVCVESGYVLMSEDASDDDNGKHRILLDLTETNSNQTVVEYIMTNQNTERTRTPFPRVTIEYSDDDDNGINIPKPKNVIVRDPWDDDGSEYYSGKEVSQFLCPDTLSPDIDGNNMCFRSDVVVTKLT